MEQLAPLKGKKGGNCNVTRCQTFRSLCPDRIGWYNHSTRAYYCRHCARDINRANHRDAMERFGHELCTLEPVEDVKTIEEFAKLCDKVGADHIYILFEDEIPQALRDEIYALANEKDPQSMEPVRAAFIRIGTQYKIPELINW